MGQPDDMLDDEDYPAYTMGRAAEIIGCSQDFLRQPRRGETDRPVPLRPAGTAATPATSCASPRGPGRCVDQGTALDAACRIIILEDQLEEALRQNQAHQH